MKVKMLDNKVWSINFEAVSLEKEKIEQEPEDSDIDTKLENAEEPKRKKRGRKPKIE
jgi:hypothetical protein